MLQSKLRAAVQEGAVRASRLKEHEQLPVEVQDLAGGLLELRGVFLAPERSLGEGVEGGSCILRVMVVVHYALLTAI